MTHPIEKVSKCCGSKVIMFSGGKEMSICSKCDNECEVVENKDTPKEVEPKKEVCKICQGKGILDDKLNGHDVLCPECVEKKEVEGKEVEGKEVDKRFIEMSVPKLCCSEDGSKIYCHHLRVYCVDNTYRYCELFREIIGGTNNKPCELCVDAEESRNISLTSARKKVCEEILKFIDDEYEVQHVHTLLDFIKSGK